MQHVPTQLPLLIFLLLKQSQRSLGTDSIPATPKGILKNDGTITSLKSTRSVDNTKSLPTGAQNDRSNTETVPFPGYTMTPTSKIPEDPAVQQGSSFVSSSMDAQPSMDCNLVAITFSRPLRLCRDYLYSHALECLHGILMLF